ncbi:hypothetical protein FRC17_003164 [Serendipita sp. 399]|nr:hypothetical protein FRC17_003164 [Serendipita sp. 399]
MAEDSGPNEFYIPTISLKSPRTEIVTALRQASLSSGFFQLSDLDAHISSDLITEMFEETRRFFALSQDEKEKLSKRKVVKKNHLVGGYEGWRFYDLTKTGDGGKQGDKDDSEGGWNEGFAIAPEWGTNCFPQDVDASKQDFDPEIFQRTCKTYFHAVQELGRHILSTIAEGLGMEKDFFEDYLREQNSFCRLTHYYRAIDLAIAETPDRVEMGAAPHTDWGALTLLVQDEIGGLQVFDRNKETWHDVPPAPLGKGIVCNIGDLLAHWTNDTYRSTLHRVVAPKRGVHRYSVPFFNPGNLSYIVRTIPTCIPTGQQPKYSPITAGEWITMKHLQSTGALKT